MNLQQKMRQPFKWRAAAKVDDVLGIDRRLVRGKPAQRQAKLRVLVTKAHVRIERADVVAQIAHRNDRVDRAMEKADRKANDVEVSEIGGVEFHETGQPRHERMFGERLIAPNLSCNIHWRHPAFFY